MLVNTKHIVMFDDAADDLGRIADMVDNDGAVLMLRDGQPAYVLVAFEDVEEAGGTLSGKKAKSASSAKESAPKDGGAKHGHKGHGEKGKHKCTCGQNPGGYCEHDHGAGGGGCGGKGHGRGASGGREGRRPGGPGTGTKPWWFGAEIGEEGAPLPFPPFGFGAWHPTDGDDEPTAAPKAPKPDAFSHGKPDFLPPELNDLVPPDVMEAGKNLLNGLMGFFGPPSAEEPKDDE